MAKIPVRDCCCEDWPCCEHADNYALTGQDALDVCCPHCGCSECHGLCLEDHFDDEPWEDVDESMDGDHETGLASAGLGTDEDYEHYLYDETPLGMEYDGFYDF